MRYIEQMKTSLNYHRGVFCEVWDMFTLRGWHWLILGLWAVFCVLPFMIAQITQPDAASYKTLSEPTFAPSLSQELAVTDYCWAVSKKPSSFLMLNYYWVKGGGFQPLSDVLWVASTGLLVATQFRVRINEQ